MFNFLICRKLNDFIKKGEDSIDDEDEDVPGRKIAGFLLEVIECDTDGCNADWSKFYSASSKMQISMFTILLAYILTTAFK